MQAFKPVTKAFGGAAQLGKGLLEQGRGLAANPQLAAEAGRTPPGKAWTSPANVAKIILMGRDAETSFKGGLGASQQVAWADPLPLKR